MRRAGYRQVDVAARSETNAAVVCDTIHRRLHNARAEKVWRTIEIMVGESQEDAS